MARLQFDTRTLRDSLRWVVDHIDPNPTNAADSAVLVNPPQDGFVVLTGACDQSAARARVPYTGDAFEEVRAIHAHSLNAIVKSAPGPNIEWVLNENNVLVKSGPAKSKLPFLNSDEVSAARATTQIPRQGTVATADLIDAVGALSSLPREDASHPELAGVKIQLDDGKLEMAATDRSILGATKVSFTAQGPEDTEASEVTLDALAPHRVLHSIVRALPTDGDVWLHWDPSNQRRLALSTDNLWASFVLLAASSKFPPYEPLLKVPAETTIEVDRKALAAVLSRAGAALGREGYVFGFTTETVDDTAGEFTIKASGAFDHEEELSARVTGQSADAALLSAQYITQAVKAAGGDTVTLVLGEQRALITSDHSNHAKFVVPRIKSR